MIIEGSTGSILGELFLEYFQGPVSQNLIDQEITDALQLKMSPDEVTQEGKITYNDFLELLSRLKEGIIYQQ